MKFLLLVALGTGLCGSPACAAYIAAAEYFFGHDPGAGNGTPLEVPLSETPVFSDTVVTLGLTLPTTGLNAGLHRVGLRYRDNLGRWSVADVRYFYYVLEGLPVQAEITAAEYFLDNDPGRGNGEPIPITAGPEPAISIPLPVQSLAAGPHSIGIRYRDEYQRWSVTDVRYFYVLNEQPPLQAEIVAAEYFLDEDPGHGLGEVIAMSAGPDPAINTALDVSGLAPGLHRVGLRYRDQDQHWSVPDIRYFDVLQESAPAQSLITEAEYYFDAGTVRYPLDVSNGEEPFYSGVLNLTGLHPGLHRVTIRYRDERGLWSCGDTRFFYIVRDDGPTESQTLAGAEYFINHDPGVGYGVQIELPQDGMWDDTLETIADTVTGIPIGMHWIGIRFRDNRDNWSATAVDTFVVGPVLAAYADAEAGNLILHWQTGPGAVSFTVKRSASIGGTYETIGTTSESSFTDAGILSTPAPRHYYQIMQTNPGFNTFRLPRTVESRGRAQK